MAAGEKINPSHGRAVEAIASSGLLSGKKAESYAQYAAYVRAEGQVGLAGLRTFAARTVPDDLHTLTYAGALRRLRRDQDVTAVPQEGVLDEGVLALRQAALWRLSGGNRRHVIAAEAFSPDQAAGVAGSVMREQIRAIIGNFTKRDPIDLRILQPGAAQPKDSFTILTAADGTEQVFIEKDGTKQPVAAGTEAEYAAAWQALYDRALGVSDSAIFLADRLQ